MPTGMKYKKRKSKDENKKAKKNVQKAKKARNHTRINMSIFLAVIMISSLFAVIFYGFSEPSSTERYEGYKFKYTNAGYQTKINGISYTFDVLPQDTIDIQVQDGVIEALTRQGLISTSDPDSVYKQEIALAAYNINKVLQEKGKVAVNAFTNESENALIPVIGCQNATQSVPVMLIEEAPKTDISINNNCIKVGFTSGYDLQRASNKIIYMLLGVMNE